MIIFGGSAHGASAHAVLPVVWGADEAPEGGKGMRDFFLVIAGGALGVVPVVVAVLLVQVLRR